MDIGLRKKMSNTRHDWDDEIRPYDYGTGYRATCDRNGRVFAGCEVCWVCSKFNYSKFTCRLSLKTKFRPRGERLKEVIKDPGYFRCSYWKENDDKK